MARIIVINGADPDMGEIYKLIFEKMRNDEVTVCSSLDHGWKMIENQTPDLIWLLWSPIWAGNDFITELEACKRLRAAKETRTVPIVISSHRSIRTEEVWEAGAAGLVRLPEGPSPTLEVRDAVLRGEQQVFR